MRRRAPRRPERPPGLTDHRKSRPDRGGFFACMAVSGENVIIRRVGVKIEGRE